MKIALITLVTPTEENYMAASALPYHIAFNRNKNINFKIFSYNLNKCTNDKITTIENSLDTIITILHKPIWIKLLQKIKLLSLVRVFLKYPIYSYLNITKRIKQEISNYNPDVIWIYGEDIAKFAHLFTTKKIVITTPDCEAFFYQRIYASKVGYKNLFTLITKTLSYKKYITLEENFPIGKNIKYHTVGEVDKNALTQINPNIDINFIPHPHYKIIPKDIQFKNKIKLLIAGRNDIYMHDTTIQLLNIFIKHHSLKDFYSITFLGKGWHNEYLSLLGSGYKTNNIQYVENYIEEIIKYDIQITSISVGVGTKGKVLDALANGLLVIGNKLAFENIQVEHNISCVLYDSLEQLATILYDIPKNIGRYEQIAKNGRRVIRDLHGKKSIEKFFSLSE